MTISERITDAAAREVLFALEVIDPITRSFVTGGLSVKALDANGKPVDARPIVTRSGRFVWFAVKYGADLAMVEIDPGKLPFQKPAAPIDISQATPNQPVELVLTPTANYPFGDRATAVRGHLWEDLAGGDTAPVAGALVQLAWSDLGNEVTVNGDWWPTYPNIWRQPGPGECLTDANGDFAVFLRTPIPVRSRLERMGLPDVEKGRLKARLQITRDESPPIYMTVDANAWNPTGTDADATNDGDHRIPFGRLFPRDLNLKWKQDGDEHG